MDNRPEHAQLFNGIHKFMKIDRFDHESDGTLF